MSKLITPGRGLVTSLVMEERSTLPPANYISSSYQPGLGIIALRFDDGTAADYSLTYPALVARGLHAGFPVVRSHIDDTPTYMTLAQIKEIEAAGNEIICHSRTHGADPTSFTEFQDETFVVAQEMRNLGLKISSFAQPGTWLGDYAMGASWVGSPGDLYLRCRFWSYGGLDAAPFDIGYRYNMPATEKKYGYEYHGASTLVEMTATVNACINEGRATMQLIHSAKIGTDGYLSQADYLSYLDLLQTKVAAGMLVDLLPTQLFYALAACDINLTCPAITPTMDVEVASNGEFTTVTTGWTPANGATLTQRDSTVTPGVASGGTDVGCLEVLNTGTTSAQGQQSNALTIGEFYKLEALAYNPSANTQVNAAALAISGNLSGVSPLTTIEDAWEQLVAICRATNTSGNNTLRCQGSTNGDKAYFDRYSIKKIVAASAQALLGAKSQVNGVYICHPTVVSGAAHKTLTGMDICYADVSNFVRVYHNGVTAFLLSRIGGTWAIVISGAASYAAERELKVIVHNGDFSLYYNNIQIGTTQAVVMDTLGLAVYGWNTYAGNAVGAVTAA